MLSSEKGEGLNQISSPRCGMDGDSEVLHMVTCTNVYERSDRITIESFGNLNARNLNSVCFQFPLKGENLKLTGVTWPLRTRVTWDTINDSNSPTSTVPSPNPRRNMARLTVANAVPFVDQSHNLTGLGSSFDLGTLDEEQIKFE